MTNILHTARIRISVILLQIVMVSPGTNLVKNYESQFKKKSLKLKYLDLYVTRQLV